MEREALVNLGVQKIAQDNDALIKRLKWQVAEKENEELPEKNSQSIKG